jgi:hypothetical protein
LNGAAEAAVEAGCDGAEVGFTEAAGSWAGFVGTGVFSIPAAGAVVVEGVIVVVAGTIVVDAGAVVLEPLGGDIAPRGFSSARTSLPGP